MSFVDWRMICYGFCAVVWLGIGVMDYSNKEYRRDWLKVCLDFAVAAMMGIDFIVALLDKVMMV